MLASDDKSQALYLGIDGGGSKCKAIVVDENNTILGTGIAGPSNPLHGFEQATNNIAKSARLALIDAGLSDLPLSSIKAGVGLAGVNLPALYTEMNDWMHPFKEMYLATDLLIACLGAHDGQDGAVMITGTGSCGFVHIDGVSKIVGAHGFPHGDQGSGAWIGLQAVKQVLLSLDELIEETSLIQTLLEFLEVKDELQLVEKIVGRPAAFYAQMAGFVFQAANQGDSVAKAIIEEGANYISRVARQLMKKQPPRISLIGGLTPLLTPWLDDDVQAMLSTPIHPPEIGAVIFAKQLPSVIK